MAIKKVSQLDPFDNGTNSNSTVSEGGHGKLGIGKNLTFFDDGYLTVKDKQLARAVGGNESSYSSGASKITSSPTPIAIADGTTYWSSLFEVSRPSIKSGQNNTQSAKEYFSYSIQYEDVLKNILWDVKSFLNYRNNINDYNLSAIVDGNQTFKGTKKIPNLSANNLTVDIAANISNLTATNANLTNTIGENATFKNLSAQDSIAYNLSVQNKLLVSCNISASTRDLVFDGWAYGLIDRDNYGDGYAKAKKTTVGTRDGTFGKSLSSGVSLSCLSGYAGTGDPVCFIDGRPWELTCVNYAMRAYNLVDRESGKLWSVGNGKIEKNIDGIVVDDGVTSNFKAVYFKDGKPYATNVIDFAEHARWSDLGERYLADAQYEPGTLVKFGGEKEITIADTEVNAIVSTKAFDLNSCLVGGTVIALCGRVPTKVVGKIQKFDKIMLSPYPGIACKWDGKSRAIGRALESNDIEEVKLVECVTRFMI